MRIRNVHIGLIICSLLLAFPATAEMRVLEIELNKIEQRDQACRVYLFAKNKTQQKFTSFKLDVVLFNQNGIIQKNMAVNIAPLPVAKKIVKAFDLKQLDCDAIGSLLVNRVIECETASNDAPDCLSLLKLSSKNRIPFSK